MKTYSAFGIRRAEYEAIPECFGDGYSRLTRFRCHVRARNRREALERAERTLYAAAGNEPILLERIVVVNVVKRPGVLR